MDGVMTCEGAVLQTVPVPGFVAEGTVPVVSSEVLSPLVDLNPPQSDVCAPLVREISENAHLQQALESLVRNMDLSLPSAPSEVKTARADSVPVREVPVTPVETVHSDSVSVHEVPVTPVETARADSVSVREVPVTPVETVHSDSVPAREVPVTPVETARADSVPVLEVPVTPVETVRADSVPAREVPVTPVETARADSVPVREVPVTPVETARADSVSVREVPVTPVETARVDSVPAREVPVTPVETVRADSVPAREVPVTPVETVRADSVPVLEVPVMPVETARVDSVPVREVPVMSVETVSVEEGAQIKPAVSSLRGSALRVSGDTVAPAEVVTDRPTGTDLPRPTTVARAEEEEPAADLSVVAAAAGVRPQEQVPVTVDASRPVEVSVSAVDPVRAAYAPDPVVAPQAVTSAEVLVQAANAVADTLLVTPGLLRGQGEIRIQLRPDVLQGTEIRIAVTGRQMDVQFMPQTHDMSVLIERCRPQLEQHLSARIHSFQISVDVRPQLAAARRHAHIEEEA